MGIRSMTDAYLVKLLTALFLQHMHVQKQPNAVAERS